MNKKKLQNLSTRLVRQDEQNARLLWAAMEAADVGISCLTIPWDMEP